MLISPDCRSVLRTGPMTLSMGSSMVISPGMTRRELLRTVPMALPMGSTMAIASALPIALPISTTNAIRAG